MGLPILHRPKNAVGLGLSLGLLSMLPTAAHAHLGHLGEVAGHSHWAGVAALAGAVVLAGLGVLKGKRKAKAEAKAADADRAPDAGEAEAA
ncbi:DUF6732 family protein [Roseibium aestuarii]|uniref:DUF6732 family protein n=1 Tax=Roseibium aestuarii TaxID=2600299 RepID=A0ABW4JUL0_9HYPH|nr:DUF6732 family protein [Roseibium aestuarii]